MYAWIKYLFQRISNIIANIIRKVAEKIDINASLLILSLVIMLNIEIHMSYLSFFSSIS